MHLLHIIHYLHQFLAKCISLLHALSLAIHTDDRLSIALTKVYPLIREVKFHTINICDGNALLLAIHLLYLYENGIHISRWSQVDAVLGNEIIRERSTKLAYLAALMCQTAQEKSDTYEGITTIVALWIDDSTFAFNSSSFSL